MDYNLILSILIFWFVDLCIIQLKCKELINIDCIAGIVLHWIVW